MGELNIEFTGDSYNKKIIEGEFNKVQDDVLTIISSDDFDLDIKDKYTESLIKEEIEDYEEIEEEDEDDDEDNDDDVPELNFE